MANEKFDYFICTVSGGLFAYIGEYFSPEKLNPLSTLLTFFALLFLAVSFWCGLRRILAVNSHVQDNRKKIECEIKIEKAYHSIKNHKENNSEGGCNSFGEYFTVTDLEEVRKNGLVELKAITVAIKNKNFLARRYSTERDAFLVLGAVLLLFSKVLQWAC